MNLKDVMNLINNDSLTKDCEYLESIPETGFDLCKTTKYVANELDKIGIEYSACGKNGIIATIGDKSISKTILLRADMDALATDGGAAHLCGHHMHTAMLLGAARVLKTISPELKCRVKLMFQPAEEILSGAKDMIDDGAFDNPHPQEAFMLHVTSASDFDTGTFIFASQGDIAPSSDYFEIDVEGSASHGAQPDLGRDSINSAAHIICALQSINSRELSLAEQGVITIGAIHGGEAPNAIASKLKMSGSFRMYSEETRKFVKTRMEEIASSVASALRTKATVTYTVGCPPFKNDQVVVSRAADAASHLFGKDKVVILPQGVRGGGSEDLAYVSQKIPTAMALLCAGKKSDGYEHPLHHPGVRFDKKALPYGSALLAAMALNSD